MWQGEGWALREVALLQLVLAGLFSSVGLGSESPDRECCDPLYPFIPIPEVATPKDYFDPYITESPNIYNRHYVHTRQGYNLSAKPSLLFLFHVAASCYLFLNEEHIEDTREK